MKTVQVWTDKVQDANGVCQIIYDLIYTLDGTKLIAAAGSEILVYDATEGGLLKAIKAHKETVISLAPLLGGGFASGGADKQVIIWSQSFQGILKYSHNDTIQSISQNPITGVVLTCTGSDFGLYTPDVKAVPKQKVSSRIVCSAWAPDGQLFALGLFNGHVSLRSSTGEETVRIERGASPIWAVSWSPEMGSDGNVLAVADWSQRLSFFQASGNQLGKDKVLSYDPCAISHFGKGEYMLLGGSNKEAHLWTSDGMQMGKICTKEGWIWACKAKPNNEPFVAVGAADGTVSVFKINFDTVQAIYSDRFAFRFNMTEVVIQHLNSTQKARIKCRDYIKKISVYKEILAVQMPDKIVVYELIYDEQGDMHYRVKEKISRAIECSFMVVTSSNILYCIDCRLEIISFEGDIVHKWTFDSQIKFVKVMGGPKGKEGVLVGLKDGHVLKIFIDNPFPIALIQHKFSISSADINLSSKKIAIVDDEHTCSVYELAGKKLLYQEPDVTSCAWNSEVEDSICFAGTNGLTVKIDEFPSHQQRMNGAVVGFQGSQVFSIDKCELHLTSIPQTIPLEGFLERGDFSSAYKVASAGVPESDWRKLAITALEQLSLDVAKKSFTRIQDHKFLEAIRAIEKMKQDGRRETDLFQAEVSAYCENFSEAARLFKKSGNVQKAIEMYTELNMWEEATRLAEEIHEDTHDILIRKAQMQSDRKEVLEAASTYEKVGDYAQAIELLGNGGWLDRLMDLVAKLKPEDKKLLLKCIEYFKAEGKQAYALETIQKLGDISVLLAHYVELQEWESAFKIGDTHPEFNEKIYLPYGNWLALNDRFEEAQGYYTKAGRSDEAIRVLKLLAEGSVVQQRFRLAAYYYWCLSKSTISNLSKRSNISQKDERARPMQVWKEYYDLSELYYAYAQVYRYVEDPFTFSLPTTLLNAAKFVLVKIFNLPTPPGISKSYLYYCLAKISSLVGCNKLSKFAYEKLLTMKLPPKWQDTIDLAVLMIKAKPDVDLDDIIPICTQCSFKNVIFNQKDSACDNCFEPYVHSFYSFQNLPLIRFVPPPSISDIECQNLIDAEPPIEMTIEEFCKNVGGLDRQGNSSYVPLELTRQQLLNCDPNKVFVRHWPSKLIPKEYYLVKSSDTFIVICEACQHFFEEEEWNYQLLMEGQCAFCRTKY